MIRRAAVLVTLGVLLGGLVGCGSLNAVSPPGVTASRDASRLQAIWEESTRRTDRWLGSAGEEILSPSNTSASRDLKFLFTDDPRTRTQADDL